MSRATLTHGEIRLLLHRIHYVNVAPLPKAAAAEPQTPLHLRTLLAAAAVTVLLLVLNLTPHYHLSLTTEPRVSGTGASFIIARGWPLHGHYVCFTPERRGASPRTEWNRPNILVNSLVWLNALALLFVVLERIRPARRT